jgi:preprotein translocase subunit SecD
MNRYPVWKYVLIAIALLLGILYTAPNYFADSPALQITSARATVKINSDTVARVNDALKAANIAPTGTALEGSSASSNVKVRFKSAQDQFDAKTALELGLNKDPANPDHIVTVNLLKNTPAWMQAIRAMPLNLGLDLRGGVHFLMQVDTRVALEKRMSSIQSGIKSQLRDKDMRYLDMKRARDSIIMKFRDAESRAAAQTVIAKEQPDLIHVLTQEGDEFLLTSTLKPEALKKAISDGVKQNIATLNKRVNELGVLEPVIQQQGVDRIVVQLPGLQDVARAKDIIGRTAILEIRMVDETITRGTELNATIPVSSELFTSGKNVPVVLQREVVLSGDYIAGAGSTRDENSQPAVSIDLNGDGGGKMRRATRDRVGKSMAIVLQEKGKWEVLSVATIQSELGSSFRITGMESPESASELALLLRSGALYAPMDVIEERVVGPQLGEENIKKGLNSTLYGFLAISLFMILYYHVFGFFSVLALASNVLFLLALLSGAQATLTLPGIAAIALALGMAIDANVLINERIREELRAGQPPQQAIAAGFDRAWATILDSNVTTLIVGIALWVFGSGPVRGFAIVHCLGILTSMFSAVFVSRGVVNLWYGRKKKLSKVSIGTVWTPGVSIAKN